MRRRTHFGFSLLETLAALFLLALCFGALMHATSASMALAARANGYTQASLWARGLLDRVFVSEFPAEGTHSGRFDDRYRWSMTVTTPPDAASMETTVPMHLYRIELTVEWNEGGRPAKVDFETSRVVSTRPAASTEPVSSG